MDKGSFLGRIKDWILHAAEVTGLHPVNDADIMAKLFNSCGGSSDPQEIKQAYSEVSDLRTLL